MSDDSIVMFGFSILCIFFLLLGIILYRRLADDTPEDRRRLARWLGRFVIGLSCLMFLFLLLLYFT